LCRGCAEAGQAKSRLAPRCQPSRGGRFSAPPAYRATLPQGGRPGASSRPAYAGRARPARSTPSRRMLICGSDGVSLPFASRRRSGASPRRPAAASGCGLRSAWLISASPKKVQSLSAWQPNEVRLRRGRGDDDAVLGREHRHEHARIAGADDDEALLDPSVPNRFHSRAGEIAPYPGCRHYRRYRAARRGWSCRGPARPPSGPSAPRSGRAPGSASRAIRAAGPLSALPSDPASTIVRPAAS